MIKIKKLISLTLATTMITGTVLSTHFMAEDEWKVCTSFPKEVDKNGNVVNK